MSKSRRFYLVCKKGWFFTKILQGFWNLEKARTYAKGLNSRKIVIFRQVDDQPLEVVPADQESNVE